MLIGLATSSYIKAIKCSIKRSNKEISNKKLGLQACDEVNLRKNTVFIKLAKTNRLKNLNLVKEIKSPIKVISREAIVSIL